MRRCQLAQITYGVGTLLRYGVFSRFRLSLVREGSGTQRAVAAVQKHGRSIGAPVSALQSPGLFKRPCL